MTLFGKGNSETGGHTKRSLKNTVSPLIKKILCTERSLSNGKWHILVSSLPPPPINLNCPFLSSTYDLTCIHLHLLLIFYGWQKGFSKLSPSQSLLDDELIVRAQPHLYTNIWDISTSHIKALRTEKPSR